MFTNFTFPLQIQDVRLMVHTDVYIKAVTKCLRNSSGLILGLLFQNECLTKIGVEKGSIRYTNVKPAYIAVGVEYTDLHCLNCQFKALALHHSVK